MQDREIHQSGESFFFTHYFLTPSPDPQAQNSRIQEIFLALMRCTGRNTGQIQVLLRGPGVESAHGKQMQACLFPVNTGSGFTLAGLLRDTPSRCHVTPAVSLARRLSLVR